MTGSSTASPNPNVVLGQHVMVGPAGAIAGAPEPSPRRRQLADPPVRPRRAWLDAAGQHRSRGDGGGDGDAAANHRLPRTRRHRGRRGHRSARCKPAPRRTSFRTRPSSSSTCAASTKACASACSPRSSGSSTPRPRPRAPPGRRRSRRWTATPLVNDPAASKARRRRVSPAYFSAERVRRDRTGAGERGFRIVRRRVARPSVFWFVGGTDPDLYAQSQGSGPSQRTPDQPQSALCAGYPSDLADGRRDPGRRRAGLVVDAADCPLISATISTK